MTTPFVRLATSQDLSSLQQVAVAMPATHESNYFQRCLSEQADNQRQIFLAVMPDQKVLGYVQLNYLPIYSAFRRFNIPEIQDLNVIPSARRQGIGGLLVDHCIQAARTAGYTELGIGVGLHARFGAAQRLYVAKGFIPDGQGIAYDDQTIPAGDLRPVDDLLTLKMTKKL